MLVLGRPHDDSKGQSSSINTEESRRFDAALFATLDALEEKKVDYALIGGVAASGLGRPRPTQDIDLFVRPEDADALLEVLKEYGFETNRFNPSWIFKAYKENVLIDIIFRSEGGFYFDDEMKDHSVLVNYHGRQVKMVSPEDFILIKCAVHSEEGHHHWHDALSVLSQAKLNWDYLVHRSRKAPRRLLALLLYAQSSDIWVPNGPIQRIFETVFENGSTRKDYRSHDKNPQMGPRPQVRTEMGDTYLAAKVREALVKSEKIGGLGIDVLLQDKHILVRGQIQSVDQHKAILELIREMAPEHKIEDQLHVAEWKAPGDVEALQ
ncbi:MAG: nucleotidyltransferase [Pseudobdellovibrionaceae bacterium]